MAIGILQNGMKWNQILGSQRGQKQNFYNLGVLTRISKIGVKMLSSRKKFEFYNTFLLRLFKKFESETKSWSKNTPNLELMRTLNL